MTKNTEDEHQNRSATEKQKTESISKGDKGQELQSNPPENAPPLPQEEVPNSLTEKDKAEHEDDGWAPVWDANAQAYYFFNRYSQKTQWENPRIPEATAASPSTVTAEGNAYRSTFDGDQDKSSKAGAAGGYNPAIHGDYDPNADYAKEAVENEAAAGGKLDAPTAYAATGSFNRYTGKWQDASLTPENFNDENKSRRQLNAYFDVDAAANTHDGRSLKAERAGKKLSKKEVKAFREKRREKKEEKRRAWLRD